ncbi:transglycosylase SLT domain-containing protein [Pseudoduganella violacea]|uniref:Membrane-bound lytic murein transglycosylase D n=1 Tax=Pseudoduganella violacea TaxID=1715466 RepID=A0A7W5B8D3_9BURK|nr:transglycosylase SLT domain-containing protein [Pseudoduganella violacea]MBB3118419.1 membrane-bound lytic murein transglycosylase D [Pseudoduganella violacea]
MQARIKYTPLLAALVIGAAPAISQAGDSAAATNLIPLSTTATAKSSASDLPSSAKTAAKPAGEEAYREKDVWGRIRSGYAIPDVDNSLVTRHVNWYSTRPDYIDRTTRRASLYLYHVVSELEKRGMPTELALLPFIESAFNPQALSTANAAGMWQFVPGTGRDFNLKQNAFKDERRSVLASTDAALTYLQRLYDMFGDWQLALAAYNWGEGSVQKAIKRNQAAGKPTDFESLAELMPAETRNYVPKLQAVKNIVANPAQYGLTLPMIQNQPYFTAIDKTSDIDLALAAQLAELSIDEFKALNPQFNRPVITGGEQTQILLPKENAEKFHLNLAQWGRALSSWTTHKITNARERIESLASRFGTTPEVIRQANNIPQKTLLKAGSTILVPKTSASTSDIAPEIADNATVALEADRGGNKRSSYRQAGAAKSNGNAPVSLVKARVSRAEAGKKANHRRSN